MRIRGRTAESEGEEKNSLGTRSGSLAALVLVRVSK